MGGSSGTTRPPTSSGSASHTKGSGRPSITWPEAVDEALCVGWIDGIRKSVDDAAYAIRFTLRKRNSTWSAVNVARVSELKGAGRMRPAGLAAFAARKEAKTGVYSYEQRHTAWLDDEAELASERTSVRGRSSSRSRPRTGAPRSGGW